MSKIELKLRPFQVPNFVIAEHPARPRQEGIDLSESSSFPLSEVSAKDLAKMCDEFRAAVFKKAGKEQP